MRLIDADAIRYRDLSDGKGLCYVVFLEDIKKLPTVDAVEVVRCEDCRLGEKGKIFDSDCIWCRKDHQAKPMRFYCASGEK